MTVVFVITAYLF